MRRIFLVPQTLFDAVPPDVHEGLYGRHSIGIDGAHSFLVLERFIEHRAEDWLLAQPGVLELFPWDQDKPAPAPVLEAVTRSPSNTAKALAPTATLRDALRAISPACRWV